MPSPPFRSGQIIPLRFKNRELRAIVIDPNGLGEGRPTIGLGFRGMDRHTNVPTQTFVDRVSEIEGVKHIKLPSGKTFRVSEILGEDGNRYQTIEASDWVALVMDWAQNPGKLRKPARDGLIAFLAWYAAEGIYAEAYALLKRVYSQEDNQVIQNWLMSREAGKPARIDWSFEVQNKGQQNRFGYWTNYVYRGLFGMDAAEMKRTWESPVSGSGRIARNYIPETVGLEAVAYCEKMVAHLDLEDMEEAHDLAIQATRSKYKKYFPAG